MTAPRSAAGGGPRLSAESLRRLAPVELREVVVALFRRRGRVLAEVRPGAGYEDLILSAEPLLHTRKVLVRISTLPLERGQFEAAASAASAHDCVDWLLVVESHPPEAQDSRILAFAELAAVLEHEPAISRDGAGGAVVDGALYDRLAASATALQEKDPSGLAWLPALSRNQVPAALESTRQPANALFERYGLRVVTTCLLLGGRRLGAFRPGQPEPDALLWDSQRRLSLVDFKAARDGWAMGREDQRALLEYASRSYDVPGGPAKSPDAIMVISSFFSASEGSRRKRAETFGGQGKRLVHVSADDLVTLCLAARDLSDRDTALLTSVDWEPALRHHTPTADSLLARLASV